MFCCICGNEHREFDIVGSGRFNAYIGKSCNIKVNEVELKVYYTELLNLINSYTDDNIKHIINMIEKQGLNEGGVIHPIFNKPFSKNIRYGQHFINILPVQENTPASPHIYHTTNKEVVFKMIEYFFDSFLLLEGFDD